MTAVMVKTLELFAEMIMEQENQKNRGTMDKAQNKPSTITSCTPSKVSADQKVAINAEETPAAQRPT